MSNYFSGYVLDANSTSVLVVSKLTDVDSKTVLQLMPDSVLTLKEWRLKCSELVDTHRLYVTDGRGKKYKPEWFVYEQAMKKQQQLAKSGNEYVPPSVDEAPVDLSGVTEVQVPQYPRKPPKHTRQQRQD